MRTCLQCGNQTDALHCPIDGMATVIQGITPASTTLSTGTIFAGRYRILGLLGQGGMGAVFDAQHTGTGQPVAIKTLLLDGASDLDAVRRFFNEARMTAALQHPNTVRVFDFGQSDDGIFYLAMERLRGETLGEMQVRLDVRARPMSQEQAGRIAIDVLRSLAEAHNAGLVHRDLKPANIFLHDIGTGETVVKVLDFGIAKSNDSHLTKTGTSIGTPAFMSPEQVMSGVVDGRADLYALGVVLHGCVAGVLPFRADSSYSMMMKHVAEPAPSLRELQLPGVTAEFADLVQRALAKKPEDRFANAGAMREALERALGASAAQAALPTPAARTGADSGTAGEASRTERGNASGPTPPARTAGPQTANTTVLTIGALAAVAVIAAAGIGWKLSGGDAKAQPTAPGAGDAVPRTVDAGTVQFFLDAGTAPAGDAQVSTDGTKVQGDESAEPDADFSPDINAPEDVGVPPDVNFPEDTAAPEDIATPLASPRKAHGATHHGRAPRSSEAPENQPADAPAPPPSYHLPGGSHAPGEPRAPESMHLPGSTRGPSR